MKRLALLLALGTPALSTIGCTAGSIDDQATKPGQPGTSTPGNNQPGVPNGNGNGNGGNANGNNNGTPGPEMQPASAQVACPTDGKQTVGRRALRRMTNAELETTIRAAFALDTTNFRGLAVPPDPSSLDGFNNNVDRLTVGTDYVRGSLESGRKVATLVSTTPLIDKLLPCNTTGGAACADTFINTFGSKLYRRPLTPVEKGRYTALFDKTGKTDFKSFVYWATATMLQSPHVIYRSEVGEPAGNGRFKLTPYEVASELSFTLTGGPPDDALMALAAAGKLSTADEIESAARGLVFSGTQVKPAFRDVFLRFSDQWLNLSTVSNLKKDDAAFPDFTTQIQDALGEETRRLLSTVVLDEKGSVGALLTAPYTFVDTRLAKFYGFGAATGTDYARVNRPAGWGVGLLAQGSMLAVESHALTTSPTKRGYMVRVKMMCGVVPPPPAVVGNLPEPTEAETTRQRYEVIHVADVSCKACHQMMDQIGFAFEHLDATGRYRAKEGKFDIDATGVVSNTSLGELKFNGPTELAQALAKLPEVSDCTASHAAAYALGASRDSAVCLAGDAIAELRKGGGLVDFFARITRADHFRLRQQ